MKLLLAAAMLVATASSFSFRDRNLVDYRLHLERDDPPSFECTSTGLQCANCNRVVFCVSSGSGEWQVIEAGTCRGNQTCLRGECTTNLNPECSSTAGLDFLCLTAGVYPDPGDCKAYHFCVPDAENPGSLKGMKAECPYEDFGYNPKSTFCDVKLTKEQCGAYPVPLCGYIGEKGVVKANPTLFYTCIEHPKAEVLYPLIQACENGTVYYPTTNNCR